jgi:hypothetical protein
MTPLERKKVRVMTLLEQLLKETQLQLILKKNLKFALLILWKIRFVTW